MVTKSRTPDRSARITVDSLLNPVTRMTGMSYPAARTRAEDAVQAAERVKALTAIVDDLAQRPHSELVHQW